MKIVATQKFVRMSPQKLRVVAHMVSKMIPGKAVEILPHLEKRAAYPLMAVIKTAIANAKQRGIGETDLVFSEIQINEGPRLPRFRAGARGRAKPYKRRMSHIRVVLETREPEAIQEAREKIESRKGVEGNSKIKNQISKLQVKNKK